MVASSTVSHCTSETHARCPRAPCVGGLGGSRLPQNFIHPRISFWVCGGPSLWSGGQDSFIFLTGSLHPGWKACCPIHVQI